jgi:hypothetical protein
MIRVVAIILSPRNKHFATRTHHNTPSANTMLFSRNALFAAAATLVAASSGSAFAPTSTCEFPGRSHLRTMWDKISRGARCFRYPKSRMIAMSVISPRRDDLEMLIISQRN